MDHEQRPHDSGQHLLGPHVIGQRIVVRRLLRGETGPTGGPAFTDLLGVCVAWSEGTCVVQPESGDSVSIAIADIVSGKPVPPRPTTRLRVATRDAESHTGTLWPDVERVALGAWELRSTAPGGSPFKRANSCLAVGDPGRPVAEALGAVVGHYVERNRAPLVQVESGSVQEEAVLAAGWTPLPHGEASMHLASVARVRRALGSSSQEVDLAVTAPRAVASIGDGCDPLAEGRAVVDGDWLGLHGISVDAGHRRRGLATAIVGELLEWGAEQGAMTAWLHVETDNPAGVAFWESLGFAPHHTCRYYSPPSAANAPPASR